MTITPEQIAEWTALVAIATPGPWHAVSLGESVSIILPTAIAAEHADAAFIAAAREALPALLTEREELKALMLANEGVLVDAPALAVKERDRAEAAEASLAEARARIATLELVKAQLAEARAENERLREGLRQYADENNWHHVRMMPESGDVDPSQTLWGIQRDDPNELGGASKKGFTIARALLEDKS